MEGAPKVECNTRASGEAFWMLPEGNWPRSVEYEAPNEWRVDVVQMGEVKLGVPK
jgi:hypothetical protein